MLIYSKERLVPTDVNMLVISGNDGYFYIHRALYDQAVILEDIYGEDPGMLVQQITGGEESRDDVEYFLNIAPSPIRIFAPFLLLVKEELEEFEDMVGAIHVMSGPVNLRKMVKIPFEMRNTPTFSLSIKEEYRLAWDRFLLNTIPYSEDLITSGLRPMNGVQTTTYDDYEDEDEEMSNVGADGVEYEDPLEALLMAPPDDLFSSYEEELEETEDASPEPAPTPIVEEPAPEPEPVQEQKPAKPDGLGALLAGI